MKYVSSRSSPEVISALSEVSVIVRRPVTSHPPTSPSSVLRNTSTVNENRLIITRCEGPRKRDRLEVRLEVRTERSPPRDLFVPIPPLGPGTSLPTRGTLPPHRLSNDESRETLTIGGGD